MVEVLVRFPKEYRNSKKAFEKVQIANKFGSLIPLSKVAEIKEDISMATIRHLDGKRVITVRGDVDNKKMTSLKVNTILENQFKDIPKQYPDYDIEYGGEQEENVKAIIAARLIAPAVFAETFLAFLTVFHSRKHAPSIRISVYTNIHPPVSGIENAPKLSNFL